MPFAHHWIWRGNRLRQNTILILLLRLQSNIYGFSFCLPFSFPFPPWPTYLQNTLFKIFRLPVPLYASLKTPLKCYSEKWFSFLSVVSMLFFFSSLLPFLLLHSSYSMYVLSSFPWPLYLLVSWLILL